MKKALILGVMVAATVVQAGDYVMVKSNAVGDVSIRDVNIDSALPFPQPWEAARKPKGWTAPAEDEYCKIVAGEVEEMSPAEKAQKDARLAAEAAAQKKAEAEADESQRIDRAIVICVNSKLKQIVQGLHSAGVDTNGFQFIDKDQIIGVYTNLP